MSRFKISMNQAMKYIELLQEEITDMYGISIYEDDTIPLNSGSISDGPTGTFDIKINQPIRRKGIFQNLAEPMDFVNYIRILYHEEQHIKQSVIDLYKSNKYQTCDFDAKIQMAIKNIACIGNYDYYNGSNYRYNNNLAEIDAEYTAIMNTYDFLRDNISSKYAEQLICDMVNEKSLNTDYFIIGGYDNLDDIAEEFSDQYERAKFTHVKHMVIKLRQSEQVNPEDDEYVKYLQQIVKDDENNKWLLEQFWDVKDVDEKDKMVASIVLHIHPEIDYKKLYPCLINEDLSPKTVFGNDIPSVPKITYYDKKTNNWETKQIGYLLSKEKLNSHIAKANTLHELFVKEDVFINQTNEKNLDKLDESHLQNIKYKIEDELSL